MSRLTNTTTNQDTIELINSSANQYEEAKKAWQESDSFYGASNEEVYAQINEQLIADPFLKKQDADDVVLQDGNKRIPKSSKSWQENWQAVVSKFPYRNVEGLEEHYGLLVKELITEDDFDAAVGRNAQALSQYLMDHDKTLSLYQKANQNEMEFKKLLREEAIKEKERLLDLHSLDVKYQASFDSIVEEGAQVMSKADIAALEKEVHDNYDKKIFFTKSKTNKFNSLSKDFKGGREVAVKERQDIFNLLADPKLGVKKVEVRKAILYSIQKYGVNSLEEFSNEQFNAANAGNNQVYLANIEVGERFKSQLEEAIAYINHEEGTATLPKNLIDKAKDSYDLVLEKLYPDTVDEIERIIKVLNN